MLSKHFGANRVIWAGVIVLSVGVAFLAWVALAKWDAADNWLQNSDWPYIFAMLGIIIGVMMIGEVRREELDSKERLEKRVKELEDIFEEERVRHRGSRARRDEKTQRGQ